MNNANPTSESLARLRKRQLIAESAVLRAEISVATQQVRTSLDGESLAKGVLGYLTMTAYSLFKNRSGIAGIGGVRTALPLLVSGVSALTKKSWLKRVLRGALLLGMAGTVAAQVINKKKAEQKADNNSAAHTDGRHPE